MRKKRARRWLIFVFVLVINGILVSILVTDADRRCHLIDFHTVPGGVATIVHEPDSDEFDLILTGLSRKRYPIDEKVLIPMIEDLGLRKLSNLFLLSADYHALDDVLRLARIYDAARLHVRRDLRQSLQDVISLQDIAEVPELDITYYGDSTVGTAPGYYASSDGLTLKTPGANFVFTNRLSDSAFPAVVSGTESILVIGERWSPAAEDWIKLHDLGWNVIVCSDIEHPEPIDYGESELESDRYPPDYVVVLSKMGCWRLATDASTEK